MKSKLIIAIVITVIIIGLSIGETIYVDKTLSKFNSSLEKIMEQEEYSLEDIENLTNWWHKQTTYLEISISRLQLNEVTATLGELKGAVEKEDFQSASALLKRIEHIAQEIKHMYGIRLGNIL